MRCESLTEALFQIVRFIGANPNVALTRIELAPTADGSGAWMLTMEWSE